MHYIAINLLASSLFLVGLAVLYGVTGTLSMADLADKATLVAEHDRGLLHVGAAILAVAFLIKAAVWPLNAWLVPAYRSEEHTSELQSLMRISYAVFCLKKKKQNT